MNDTRNPIHLTIDTGRHRFILTRDTLEKLGNPKYIRFLVNPQERVLAIIGTEPPLPGENKIHLKFPKKGTRSEFFSITLMRKLAELIGMMDFRNNYRFFGETDEKNGVVYFSADNIVLIERGRKNVKA